MSRMAGPEVADRLHAVAAALPGLHEAATGRPRRENDRRLAVQAGVDHYLQKPISPVAVARLVAALPA